MQESQIQKLRAGEASRLQLQERVGEEKAEGLRLKGAETARGLEYSKTGTLLGMSQQREGAANQARAQAKAQQMGAIGDIASAGLSMVTAGMKMGAPGGGGTGGMSYTPDYDPDFDTSGIGTLAGGRQYTVS
jgi:hypothetical protein